MIAPPDPNQLFAQAEHYFRAGDAQAAGQTLDQLARLIPPHPAVLHLSALVAKQLGEHIKAMTAFQAARKMAPGEAQIGGNYANLLADMGRFDEALLEFEQAIANDPGFDQAALNRALLLDAIGRHVDAAEALAQLEPRMGNSAPYWNARAANARHLRLFANAGAAYGQALVCDQASSKALHGLARVKLERGESDAALWFGKALDASPGDPAITIGLARALQADGQGVQAVRAIEQRLGRDPQWIEGLTILAEMRWENGDGAGFDRDFRKAMAQAPDNAALRHALIDLQTGLDQHASAVETAREAAAAFPHNPAFALAEAVNAGVLGDMARAEALYAKLEIDTPDSWLHEARHRIRRGEMDRAQALLTAVLERRPGDVGAWALLGLIWRAEADERHVWLHGQPGLIGTRTILIDPDAVAAATTSLRDLHRSRAHPIGQSVRGGTQTRGMLFAHHDPRLAPLTAAISKAVEAHWQALPAFDAAHPLLRHRDQSWHFSGSWSVRLLGGGFHTHHIHPNGLLSSACYIVVPETPPGDVGPALEIGRPPADLLLDLAPLETIQPSPGTLVLFPSTLFHGTRPVRSGERLTVAFDVAAVPL